MATDDEVWHPKTTWASAVRAAPIPSDAWVGKDPLYESGVRKLEQKLPQDRALAVLDIFRVRQ